MKGLKILGIALSITAVSAALATGWTVNVTNSQGILFSPPTTTNVPFNINGTTFLLPATVTVSGLPQITFLTSSSTPPILAGDGTLFTGGTYAASYTITTNKQPLIGFNFVIRGFVWGLGQIVWSKKVVDRRTSQILYLGGGVFNGASYPGGANGIVNFSQFISLAQPSSDLKVIETFLVHVDGAPVPGTDTAWLQFVQQDWVPEPASMLALSVGLAGLAALRRRAKK